MRLVIKNWLDFIRNHTFLYVMMMLVQLVSVLCIYFVYGVFQNNIYVLMEGDRDSYEMTASFSEDSEKFSVDEMMEEMVEEWEFDIDLVYIVAVTDGENSYQDRIEYHNGKYSYSSRSAKNVSGDLQGGFATSEQYDKGEKVVIISPENEGKELGDVMELEGEDYRIIGISSGNALGEYEMPFTAFPKEARIKQISVLLNDLPTRGQYERLSQKVIGYGGKMDDFVIANNEDLKKQYSLIFVSVLLALLSGGNLFLVYCYVFRQRKEQLVAYQLYGCTRKKARNMFFIEILINMILAVVMGLLLFIFVVYPIILNWYEHLFRIYSVEKYIFLTALYIVVTVVFGSVISAKMTKLSLLEFRRED